jgi:Fe-Mn family superoxide dismutase
MTETDFDRRALLQATAGAGGEPILVLDMYEHAYQMNFGAKTADYVTTIMGAINRAHADRLYAQYSRG